MLRRLPWMVVRSIHARLPEGGRPKRPFPSPWAPGGNFFNWTGSNLFSFGLAVFLTIFPTKIIDWNGPGKN